MKNALCLLFCLAIFQTPKAQEKLYFHKSDHVADGVDISDLDSLSFSDEGTTISISINGQIWDYPLRKIDSLSFGNDSDELSIVYNDGYATVVNPRAFEGVSVTVKGAEVCVTSASDIKDIAYRLSGKTSDGAFKIYSEKRFHLYLNGLDLTHNDGPAINIQSKKTASVTLVDGTVNFLADGTSYAQSAIDSEGAYEDQKATFFSEGSLVFDGNGQLILSGKGADQHGIGCDETIEIRSGNFAVQRATKDGIHAKEGISIYDGIISIVASGDGM
ncbi:MAG TPA: carbohydrate-binding domain-containing protein, partial [Prolixibacteraceae bacterium]|nr:carbohydrate-binding domain-containing protein [Prolixibacteraceae bacterium]